MLLTSFNPQKPKLDRLNGDNNPPCKTQIVTPTYQNPKHPTYRTFLLQEVHI
uniref:Uncharacterized protein n=1 Tax=Arundo donax TaxID=35708 RepID=A0A0A8ZEC6_ARUDO